MRVLGIETSCDETGVALYSRPAAGLSPKRLSSQVEIHAAFGGVVPELASRDHIAKLAPLVEADASQKRISRLSDLDAIAYTAGPGLIGALMVGGSFAARTGLRPRRSCGARASHGGPFARLHARSRPAGFPVRRAARFRRAHAARATWRASVATESSAKRSMMPPVRLSTRLRGCCRCRIRAVPRSRALADTGDPERFAFPRPLAKQGLDFSFSGLKTAVRLVVESCRTTDSRLEDRDRADIAASFQAAAVDSLVAKCEARARSNRSRAPRGCRRRGREPRVSATQLTRLRSAGWRARVLSATGVVHGQWRHDRVRGLATAQRGAVGAAAHRREAALAAR